VIQRYRFCKLVANLKKILGRSSKLTDYVKRGKHQATVEIELTGENDNVVVSRTFNAQQTASKWTLNGQTKNGQEVMAAIARLRIQVDNLLQVLPQDRVSKFAEMTHETRFRETQKAVLGTDALDVHDQLIHFKSNEKKLEEVQFDPHVAHQCRIASVVRNKFERRRHTTTAFKQTCNDWKKGKQIKRV